MQYQLLASDFDNTLVPFGEPKPHPAVVRAVKKMQAAGGARSDFTARRSGAAPAIGGAGPAADNEAESLGHE